MELKKGLLPSGKRYIREDVLLARREPQVVEGLNEYYGMGLKIDRQWGVPLIHHGGTTTGYRALAMWLPEHNVGAVILINSDTGSALRPAFRRRLLELLFDGKPIASPDLVSSALSVREEAVEYRKTLTVPADPELVSPLARRYRNTELGDVAVSQTDGKTWFDFGGWKSEMATRK